MIKFYYSKDSVNEEEHPYFSIKIYGEASDVHHNICMFQTESSAAQDYQCFTISMNKLRYDITENNGFINRIEIKQAGVSIVSVTSNMIDKIITLKIFGIETHLASDYVILLEDDSVITKYFEKMKAINDYFSSILFGF